LEHSDHHAKSSWNCIAKDDLEFQEEGVVFDLFFYFDGRFVRVCGVDVLLTVDAVIESMSFTVFLDVHMFDIIIIKLRIFSI
jgi:hypothetical protein